MLKQFISLLILSAVLLIFYKGFKETSYVNSVELNKTRERAVLLAKRGEYESSLKILKALREIDFESKEVWGDYLLVLIDSGGEEEAYQLVNKEPVEMIPLYAYKKLFGLVVSKSDPELALLLAEQEIKSSSNVAQIALSRSELLSVNGYAEESNRLLNFSLDYIDDNESAAITVKLLAKSSITFSEEEQAVRIELSHGYQDKRLWLLYKNYWVDQARQGDVNKAISALEVFVDTAPDDIGYFEDYFVLHNWNKDYDNAYKVYQQRLEDKDNPDYVKIVAAELFYMRGDLDDSKRLYAEVAQNNPQNIEAKKKLASIYLEKGAPAEVLALFVPLNSYKDSETLTLIGVAQRQLGQNDEALSSLTLAINSSSHSEEATYRIWLDSFNEMLNEHTYEALWARYSIPLHAAPVSVKSELQQHKAINLKHVASKKPSRKVVSHQESIKFKAAFARQQGRSNDAVRLYQKSLVLEPNNRELILGLALALIDAGESMHSIELLDLLSELYPNDKQILDAKVYYGQQFNQADILSENLKSLAELSKGAQRSAYLKSWINHIRDTRFYLNRDTQLSELSKFSIENNPTVVSEQSRLLFENGDCDSLIQVTSPVHESQFNVQQLEDVAYRLRRCGYYQNAHNLYQYGINQYPNVPNFYSGAILSLVNLNDLNSAKTIVECCGDRFEGDLNFVLAQAYYFYKLNEFETAQIYYKKALSLQQNNNEARIGEYLSLAELGEAEAAFAAIDNDNLELSNEQYERLSELRIKQMLRMAENAHDERKITLAISALEIIDEFQTYLKNENALNEEAILNSELNQLHAYVLMEDSDKAVALYESLNERYSEIPRWAQMNAIDAYLLDKQPSVAVDILEELKQISPSDLDVQSKLLFVYMDVEDFNSAKNVMNDMNQIVDSQANDKNHVHWVNRLDAMFQAYQNKLRVAEARLIKLNAKQPRDLATLNNLATVYRWQGKHKKSQQAIDEIKSAQVSNISLDVSQAHLFLDANYFHRAEDLIKKLDAEHSYHPEVKRLKDRWLIRNKKQYTVSTQYGKSTGNALGNKDFTLEQRLYSSPINNNYRLYIRDRYDWTEFPEDNGNLHRIGLGGEYNSPDLYLSAELNASVRDDADVGANLNAEWKIDDHLSAFAGIQTYSRHVPLRGINAGVDGESVDMGAQYRWNESQYVRASVSYTDSNDGNERTAFFIQHQHDVYQSAHHQVYLSEEFYTSNNTLDNASYFNPDDDYSFRLAGKYNGILWREDGDSLTHKLEIGVGNYKQANESNAAIWDLEYQHIWLLNKSLEVKYGFLHRRRTYDGEAESYNAVTAGLNLRF